MTRRMLDELIHYAKETGAFAKPEIRHKLVDLAIDIKTLRILAMEAAWKVAKGEMVIHEPSRDKALNDLILEKVGQIGTEIIGAFAQVDPLEKNAGLQRLRGLMEWIYFSTPGMWAAAGTTDTNRNIVAQFGLGLPRGY
jgi:alkylation response protein AidB-like acyl-CoA dehydrogenase